MKNKRLVCAKWLMFTITFFFSIVNIASSKITDTKLYLAKMRECKRYLASDKCILTLDESLATDYLACADSDKRTVLVNINGKSKDCSNPPVTDANKDYSYSIVNIENKYFTFSFGKAKDQSAGVKYDDVALADWYVTPFCVKDSSCQSKKMTCKENLPVDKSFSAAIQEEKHEFKINGYCAINSRSVKQLYNYAFFEEAVNEFQKLDKDSVVGEFFINEERSWYAANGEGDWQKTFCDGYSGVRYFECIYRGKSAFDLFRLKNDLLEENKLILKNPFFSEFAKMVKSDEFSGSLRNCQYPSMTHDRPRDFSKCLFAEVTKKRETKDLLLKLKTKCQVTENSCAKDLGLENVGKLHLQSDERPPYGDDNFAAPVVE